MHKIGMNGTISAIIAVAAMLLLVFSINSSVMAENNDSTFAKMQAYKETALKTEQAVRILDNAAAKLMSEKTGSIPLCAQSSAWSSVEIEARLESVADQFEQSSGGISCSITPTLFFHAGNTITAIGTLDCTSNIGSASATDSRVFSFVKIYGPNTAATQCIVKDSISGCQEQPSFSC